MIRKILFIGPQGSGKSTQAKLLAEALGLPYLSTGDIFRQMQGQIKQILDQGKLVDDQTTSGIVEQRLKRGDLKDGFIFDGYPRTLEQIRLFDPGFDKVIYLDLPDEKASERLLARGREDDTKELIAERLKHYHEQTDPILDFYKQKGMLVSISGEGSIKEIAQKIRDGVNG